MLDTAIQAAMDAGGLLRENFGTDLVVNESHAHDIKLQLDVQTQELIETILLKEFPHHAILGEEGIRGKQDSDYRWIIDPLDGTVNFTYGIPHFAVSIALEERGQIVLGVVYDPITDELFSAERGKGAFLNDQPIRVSDRSKLADAMLVVGMSKYNDSIEAGLKMIGYYAVNARKLRNMGSAALAMAYIAAGRLDGYLERNISLWDVAAGKVLVEEAGGVVHLTPNDSGKNYKIETSNGKIDLSYKP